MSGILSEYELTDCPKGQRDPTTGNVRKVTFDYQKRCDFSDKCIISCKRKKVSERRK